MLLCCSYIGGKGPNYEQEIYLQMSPWGGGYVCTSRSFRTILSHSHRSLVPNLRGLLTLVLEVYWNIRASLDPVLVITMG